MDIDLADPSGEWGFDLYGGASTPEQAADRPASALLRGDERAVQSLTDRLKARGELASHRHLLDARKGQRERRDAPAASLIERMALLDRPALAELLDGKRRRFAMTDLNRPLRMRLGLPEGLLVLLTRSLGDFPELRPTVFGSVGCTAAFARSIRPTRSTSPTRGAPTGWTRRRCRPRRVRRGPVRGPGQTERT